MRNTRLEEMLRVAVKNDIPEGIYLLDCFMGKQIRSEYSRTITTRTATDKNTFVMEIEDE